MWSRAAIFGAPVTDPGGKVASIASAQPTPGRRRPSTVDTRWTRPGCGSTAHSAGTWTEAHSQTRPRSLRTRSTIITFSARSFGEQRRRGRGRALDRRRPDPIAVAGQEALGRRRGDVDAVGRQADHGAERRRVALGERRAERGDVGVRRGAASRAAGSGSPGRRRRRRSRRGSSARRPRTRPGRGSWSSRVGTPGHGSATPRSGRTDACGSGRTPDVPRTGGRPPTSPRRRRRARRGRR